MKKILPLIGLLFVSLLGFGVIKNPCYPGYSDNFIVLKAEQSDVYTKEDFLADWNSIVRKSDTFDPCSSLTRSEFKTIKQKFDSLSIEDQEYVLKQKDGNTGNTIGQTLKLLTEIFNSANKQSRGDGEISESMAVGIIVTVSLVGMTTICIFYILKTKKIIQ